MDISPLAGRRLRLADDAIVLRYGAGALFRNDAGVHVLPQPGAFDVFSHLAADLTGQHSLEEIGARQPPADRPAIVRLLEHLIETGIVYAVRERRDTAMAAAVAKRFSSQITLIDRLSSTPGPGFAAVRESRVVLMGNGVSLRHCAAALIRNGVGAIEVVDREPTRDWQELDAEAQALRDLGIDVDARVLPAGDDAPVDASGAISLVMYVADQPAITDLAHVARRALREHCPVLAGFIVGDQILLGPLAHPPACLVCTFERLTLHLCNRDQRRYLQQLLVAGRGRFGLPAAVSEWLAHRLGGEAAFEAFKHLAGSLRPFLEHHLLLQTRRPGADAVRAVFVPCVVHSCWGGCDVFNRPLPAQLPGAQIEWSGPLFTPPTAGIAPRVEHHADTVHHAETVQR